MALAPAWDTNNADDWDEDEFYEDADWDDEPGHGYWEEGDL